MLTILTNFHVWLRPKVPFSNKKSTPFIYLVLFLVFCILIFPFVIKHIEFLLLSMLDQASKVSLFWKVLFRSASKCVFLKKAFQKKCFWGKTASFSF